MAFWNTDFLTKRRSDWMGSIYKAQYYAGTTWYDAVISEKYLSGTTIIMKIVADSSFAMTITKVRLIDITGSVAGEKTESIAVNADQAALIQLSIPIYEV